MSENVVEIRPLQEGRDVEAERDLLREIAEDAASAVFEDSRVKYVEIQIDRETWERLAFLREHGRLGSEAEVGHSRRTR